MRPWEENRPPFRVHPEIPACEAYVPRRRGLPANAAHGLPCGNKGKVEHDGKWYCRRHAPKQSE